MICKPDRIKIDYYKIEGSPGGSQDWFSDYWMHIGGCGALAACDMAICLSQNLGLSGCCPCNPRHMTKNDYIELGMRMKAFIRPRVGGVIKTSIFTDGFRKYLREQGYQADIAACQGTEDYVKARRFVKAALRKNLPVAYLMLQHKDKRYGNINWHWFTVTGFTEKNGKDMLTYHTYGRAYTVDFRALWDTGRYLKGGMAAVSRIIKKDP